MTKSSGCGLASSNPDSDSMPQEVFGTIQGSDRAALVIFFFERLVKIEASARRANGYRLPPVRPSEDCLAATSNTLASMMYAEWRYGWQDSHPLLSILLLVDLSGDLRDLLQRGRLLADLWILAAQAHEREVLTSFASSQSGLTGHTGYPSGPSSNQHDSSQLDNSLPTTFLTLRPIIDQLSVRHSSFTTSGVPSGETMQMPTQPFGRTTSAGTFTHGPAG